GPSDCSRKQKSWWWMATWAKAPTTTTTTDAPVLAPCGTGLGPDLWKTALARFSNEAEQPRRGPPVNLQKISKETPGLLQAVLSGRGYISCHALSRRGLDRPRRQHFDPLCGRARPVGALGRAGG